MDLAQRIQAKTDNGDTIIDFLVEVMTDQLDHFKMNHRLQAARLLTKYGCSCRSAVAQRDEGIAFILNNLPEPSQDGSTAGSSDDSEFDQALAKKIQEATDDGSTVCRFLINVMEGELKAFKPHHRISAARELLSRGFGKHARQASFLNNRPPLPAGEGWGEGENQEYQPIPHHSSPPSPCRSGGEPVPDLIRGRNPEMAGKDGSHSSLLSTHSSESEDSEDDQTNWDEINALIDAAKEESDRILTEQGTDPDNPPYKTDYSVFDEAADNSHRWFLEWKNSLDPDEYHTIVKEGAERFSAEIDLRIERRKQIKVDQERREKEEAEREREQAKARAEAKEKAEAESAAAKEIEDLGPPPAREDHERWSPTPSIPTSFRLVNCGHPKCKLHDGPVYYPEDDKSSPYYWDGGPPITSRIFNPRF